MDFKLLSYSPLFTGLEPADIESLISGLYRIREYREGYLIAQSGDIVNSLMLVVKGSVKGEMVDYSGRVIKIEDINPPGALAAAFIFGNNNRFPVNVISISDTELLVISRSEFLILLRSHDKILTNFLDMISNRSQFLSEKIKFLNFKTIKGKLAQFLLQQAGTNDSVILLDMTHNELAGFFGVARPSLSRVLGELEEEGFIEAKGKKITIIDKKGLTSLTSE